MSTDTSEQLFLEAQQYIPGGVNSPVRAFRSVGGVPPFIRRAEGAYLYDEDGNRYIDLVNSWGPMILGHAYGPVVEAIRQRAGDGTSFGAPTRLETDMAKLIVSMVPYALLPDGSGFDLLRTLGERPQQRGKEKMPLRSCSGAVRSCRC